MAELEITVRTKAAVRRWGSLGPTVWIFLDTKLEDVRPNHLLDLLVAVNEEFQGENGFPISSNDWDQLAPKIVRDIRDEVQRRSSTEVIP